MSAVGQPRPLVVDLDGTLLRTDTLLECFWHGMGTAPLETLRIAATTVSRRAELKARLAALASPDVAVMPRDEDIAALIAGARAEGRPVHLVSGADATIVAAVDAAHGPFDGAIGSDGKTNLTSRNKAARLVGMFGQGGFDYAGDSSADIEVWRAAATGYVARPSPRFAARLAREGVEPVPLGAPWTPSDLVLGLRPHQWLKNLLMLLPLIAAHRLAVSDVVSVAIGIVAFSALASAIYIVNDLTDLDADRLHETKRLRPFASGRVPIKAGMVVSAGLGLLGLALGAALGPAMLGVLLVYLVATLAYSMHLKRVRWADVTMLAGLYTLRVVAGAAAAGVAASGWLFGFVFPLFLCLGCVKRLTELARARDTGFLPGRRYQPSDRGDLRNVGVIAALFAVAVFLAYGRSDTASELYARPWMLGLVAVLLAMWLGRMLWTGWVGRQDYDPIIFASTDRIGLGLVLASVALLWLAAT